MKPQTRVADFIAGVRFEGMLLVKLAQEKVSTATQKKYLDMTLTDASGEVNAKLFNLPAQPYVPAEGAIVNVRGQVEAFNGTRLQLKIDTIREANERDDVDIARLVPCAPRPSEEMLDEVLNRADAISNPQLKMLVLKRLEEAGERVLTMPAAKSMHHAQRGGLLYHTVTMLEAATAICALYPGVDADLVAAGAILHDLGKLDEFATDGTGLVSDYTLQGNLVGHIVGGIAALDRCGRELGVDNELLMLLEHMLLSHHGQPEYGSPKPPMIPEALILHMVDDLDAKIFEMQKELNKVAPGSFTDYVKGLDRKLYRRSES